MANNGGKVAYGEVDKIVKAIIQMALRLLLYNKYIIGFLCKKKCEYVNKTKVLVATIVTTTAEMDGAISGLTDDQYNTQIASISIMKTGGRKKGSTKKKTKENISNINAPCWYQTQDFVKKKGLTNVPSGALKKLMTKKKRQGYPLILSH